MKQDGKFRFLKSRVGGFYLILFLCLASVAIIGYVVTDDTLPSVALPDNPALTNLAPNTNLQALQVEQDVVVSKPTPAKTLESNVAKATPAPKAKVLQVVQNTTANDTKPDPEPTPEPTPKLIQKLSRPLMGEILVGFSMDKMIYSTTLGDWRTHSGVDIRSSIGTQVKAAEDGIVQSVYKDDMMGITVLLDHGGGLQTKYSNLSSLNMVEEGQHVSKGDVINGVGDTAMSEISLPAHLHFEVIKDGENVDPQDYLLN